MALDARDGTELWEGKGLTMNPIPSPVYDDELVYLMSGFQGHRIHAVRLADARGDIDGTPVLVERDLSLRGNRYLYTISAR